MEEYSYQNNEWCVVYVDDNGDRQIVQFDLFEQANEFIINIRNNSVCVIGIMTSAFYKHCVKKTLN